MRKLRGLSVMLCVLLALQLAIPYWTGVSAGQTDDSGRVQAELFDQSPESVTWRITLNAAGGEHEEIRAAIRLGAGLTPGTVTDSGNAHVSQTADGYDVTAGPGSGTIRLDLTAAITDPTLLICEIRVTASYPDGDFKASHQAEAIKPETPEPEPEAAPEETDEPEELPAEEDSGALPEEDQSGPEAPPADSPDQPAEEPSEGATEDQDVPGGQPAEQPEAPADQPAEPSDEPGAQPEEEEVEEQPPADQPSAPVIIDDNWPPKDEEEAPADQPSAPVVINDTADWPADTEPDAVLPDSSSAPVVVDDSVVPDEADESDEQLEEDTLTELTPPKAGLSAASGEYSPDPNGVVIPTTMEGISTNAHTIPVLLWATGNTVYSAVKSTHELEFMTLDGLLAHDRDTYAAKVPIRVSGKDYQPEEGLNGNTKDAHWTVFKFDASKLFLEDKQHYPFFIDGIGNGHDVGDKLVVTIPTTDVTANKAWVGGTERPPIDLQLIAQADGEARRILETQTVNGTETEAWSHTWLQVPKYNPFGRPYVFTADEAKVPVNYVKTINGLTVTNTYEPVQRIIQVEKRWIGPTGESATVRLTKDGADTDQTVVLNEANNWTGSFTVNKLDDRTGNPIAYDVEELEMDGYSSVKTGSMEAGFIFTNTSTSTTQVNVVKKWVGPKAGPVTIQLIADREATEQTLTLSEETSWAASFTDLPRYHPVTGEEIVYSVEELQVPAEYEVSYSRDEEGAFIVTNTAQAAMLTVLKVDESDQPLAGATFELRDADGETAGTGTSGTDGKITFGNLEWGNYTLVETKAPEGYRLSANPVEVTIGADSLNVEKKVVNTRIGWELPNTGGVGTTLFYGAGAVLMATAGFMLFRRRDEEE
ncbi:LPXTG-motif cell wall anchor domain-containing protein [Bhargavaea ginsengi]|uniref:LPXTG-motif cell wall anchor domain-containing protein n=1 Tax=Bhargavaea ginsengi TaxID=426757 RepID=A0A1H6UZ16_9BACL|nr:Cna B-type domain-containing protein [Bhargavaea ginsengi]SEI94837.1 LPXTG-motif cell wall anchor domain-containing protein [Bhargavaea ginsengi]